MVVREFYYILEFFERKMKMAALVQGRKLNIDVELLGRIMDVPIYGVRTISRKKL